MITFTESEIITSIASKKQLSKTCGMIGNFETGPCLEIVNISNTDEFKRTFGYPNKDNFIDWHNAFNFLQYSDNLDIVRVIKTDIKNAGIKFSTAIETVYETNLYNKTVAETKLNSLTNTGILFFNKFSKTEQDLSILICTNETDWNRSISNEVVTKDDSKFTYITYNNQLIRIAYSSKIQNSKTGAIKTFKELFPDKPNFSNHEFLVVILKQSYSGIYNVVENFIVSSEQESIRFIDQKLFDNSDYIYGKFFNMPTVDSLNLSVVNTALKKSTQNKVNLCTLSTEYDTARDILVLGNSTIFMAYESIKTVSAVDYLCVDEMCKALITKPNSLIIINHYSEKRYEPNINNEETILSKVMTDFASTREGAITNNYYNAFSKNVLIYVGTKIQFSQYLNKLIYIPFLGDISGLISNSKKYEIVAGPEKSVIKNCRESVFNFGKESTDILKFNGINTIVKVHYNDNFFLSNMKTSKSEKVVYQYAKNIVLENDITTDLLNKLNEFKGKNNDSLLRNSIKIECEKYLISLRAQKIITNYSITCDLTNNTDNSKILNVRVIVYVSGFIEEIIVDFEVF